MAELSAHDLSQGRDFHRVNTLCRRGAAWGYSIEKNDENSLLQKVCEIGLKASGYSFIVFALSFWVLPGADLSFGAVVIKAALSICFGLLALGFLSFAGRGLRKGLHVDTKRQQLRGIWINHKKQAQVHFLASFEEVASVFVRPSRLVKGEFDLCIRLVGARKASAVLSGDQAVVREVAADVWASLAKLHQAEVPSDA